METEEMQRLMGATPQVARTMRPIFRMFGLDETVLKVPAGYGAAAVVADPNNDLGSASAQQSSVGLKPDLRVVIAADTSPHVMACLDERPLGDHPQKGESG
jgi:hypothetical protein